MILRNLYSTIIKSSKSLLVSKSVVSSLSCPGCGAPFQLNFENNPGYINYDLLNDRMILDASNQDDQLIYIRASKEVSPSKQSPFTIKPSFTRLELQRIKNRINSNTLNNLNIQINGNGNSNHSLNSNQNHANNDEINNHDYDSNDMKEDCKRHFTQTIENSTSFSSSSFNKKDLMDHEKEQEEEYWDNNHIDNHESITKSQLKNHGKRDNIMTCHRCYSLENVGRWNMNSNNSILDHYHQESSLSISLNDKKEMDMENDTIFPLLDSDKKLLTRRLNDNSLIIMVINILDIPYSIIPNLWKLLCNTSYRPKLIVVANKWDLMPLKGFKSIQKWKEIIEKMLKNVGLVAEEIHFSSAKKGWNIEKLQSTISRFLSNQSNNHAFILGRTNVGKSSLYNKLYNHSLMKTNETSKKNLQKRKNEIKKNVENEKIIEMENKKFDNHSTVGFIHGTTIGILKKKIPKLKMGNNLKNKKWRENENYQNNEISSNHLNSWLHDLPGIITLGKKDIPSSYLDFERINKCVIKDPIGKSHKHILRIGESFLISELCRIDCMGNGRGGGGKNIEMELFMRSDLFFTRKQTKNLDLPIIETSIEEKLKNVQLNEKINNEKGGLNEKIPFFEFKEAQRIYLNQNKTRNIDVIFLGDLGWISINLMEKKELENEDTNIEKDEIENEDIIVSIHTPGGIGIITRNVL